MSMTKFAGAGPIMGGLAAFDWFDAGVALNEVAAMNESYKFSAHELSPEGMQEHYLRWQAKAICDDIDRKMQVPEPVSFALSNDDLARMIENVADQLSEVAAQMVDVRQRLAHLDRQAQQRATFAAHQQTGPFPQVDENGTPYSRKLWGTFG